MFEFHRLSAISALVACFGVLGCGEQPKEATGAAATPAVAGHDHGDGSHSHSQAQEGPQLGAHGGVSRSLGSIEIAGATLEISASGDIAPNAELHVDVNQTAGPPLAAIRLWIGEESGVGSLKSKADANDGHFHGHVEAPLTLSMDSALWVEAEDADGKRSSSSVSLREHG
jgi:hypothetical protein